MKHILITGGKGYLGKVVARVLRESGYSVLDDPVDVTNEKEMEKYAKEIQNKYGEILGIIHAASAPLNRKKVLDESLADFKKQFEVTAFGAFNLFRYFCPLISSGGAVIGVLSKGMERQGSSHGHPKSGSYIPAKYALRGLLRGLTEELQGSARVYGIAPAFMNGGLNRDLPQAVSEFIIQKSPPQNTTTPEEVALAIIKLLADENGNMNGKFVTVPENIVTDL